MHPLVPALALTLAASPAWAQPANLPGMDADSDGRVSRPEYRAGLVGQSLKWDRNGDGRIAPSELPAAARLPGVRGIAERVIRSNDRDGDGALSSDELAARADVRFGELDRNRDGFVDASEMKAGRRR